MKKRIRTVILFCLVVIWISGIFCLSHQSSIESGEISTAVAERVYENVDITPERFEYKNDTWLIAHYELFMRKFAHLFLYIILGALLTLSTAEFSKKKRYIFIVSSLLGIAYAVFDEIHQHFIPGRSFLFKDIIIDSFGVIIGTVVILLALFVISKIRFKRSKNDND